MTYLQPIYISKPDMRCLFRALARLSTDDTLAVPYGSEGYVVWRMSAYNWARRHGLGIASHSTETHLYLSIRARQKQA